MENMVREFRKAADLSQAALADLAHTSQQQIQRIESGVQTVRLDVAQAIANALNAPLATVFPPEEPLIDEALEDFPDFQATIARIFKERSDRRFDDTDLVHTIIVSLRGGHSLQFPVSTHDSNRFERLLLDDTNRLPYLVFDSYTHVIAINRLHVTRAQRLFDRMEPSDDDKSFITVGDAATELDEDRFVVLMATEPTPVELDIEPDVGDLDSDPPGQLANLFFNLESDLIESGFFSIEDVDGESALFSVEDIAAIAVHHQWVGNNFGVWNEEDEEEQEDLSLDA